MRRAWIGVMLLLGSLLAQAPKNVFVVVIDGMRNMEGFESESLYLRHIWNDLKPLGTINKKFWDHGYTVTTAGHTTILSGVRQVLMNNGSHDQDIRSFDPLMFEYYRKTFGTPESSCGAVTGKWGNVGDIADYSLEPAYGASFKGARFGDTTTGADSMCSRRVHLVMDSIHPRLVLVNLGDVDHQGHLDTFAHYVQAIRDADSMIYEFWKHIQAIPPYTDTFYRNKTVLIVTDDHGRHDDAHGGFRAHGNWDHGCRHIMFLAIGPGVAQNRVIDNIPRDQIDIVPTVAAMLGFPAPFAEGQVMSEIFTTGVPRAYSPGSGPAIPFALNLSGNTGFSRDPDIARDRNGNLYCVWSDNTPGKWSVQYRKSTDNGASWSTARAMFDYPASESLMWFARVAADDSVAISAMGYGKVWNWLDPARTQLDTTFVWYPWIATSADAGTNWSTTSLLDSSMVSYYAPVSVRNGRYGLAWIATGQFTGDTNGIEFNHRLAGGSWRTTPARPMKQKNPIHVALADDGTNFHSVATGFQTEDWDIRYSHSTNGDTWTTRWIVNDSAGAPTYDYDPEIVTDDSNKVHVVWSRKPNSGGVWQIMYARLDSIADAWDTFRLTNSSAGAWQPHIACKRETLALVWIDYRDGNPELYCMFSINRGRNWSAPERITYTEALTHHPRVAPIAQGFYVVWQDMQSGNWDVYGRQIGLPTGRDVGVIQISSPMGSVESTGVVTPQASFRNYGLITATFKALFRIQDSLGTAVYRESVIVADVPGGGTTSQSFPVWPKPYALGNYATWCSVSFAGDTNSANDLLGGSFAVVLPAPNWYREADFPLGPRIKNVKDGCALGYLAGGGEGDQTVARASCPCTEVTSQNGPELSAGYVYALKGSNTCEFYRYNTMTNIWETKESIPAFGRQGRKKTVKKGSTLAGAPDGELYATKGNNTLEFWRYDPNAPWPYYPWFQLTDVPMGMSIKMVRDGAGAAAVKLGETTYVYLLKGASTTEFYRYNAASQLWQIMPNAPFGISNKGFKYGSGLTGDGAQMLYALKAGYNEFYAYDLNTNIWATRAPLPFVGRLGKKKKVAAGGALAARGHTAYALKGNNTTEFWTYSSDSNRWTQGLDAPTGAGKKVKGGGALVLSSGNGGLYATKGSNTAEFYMYYPLSADRAQFAAGRSEFQVATRDNVARFGSLQIAPNPFSRTTTIDYYLPRAGNVTLELYDVTGALVSTLVSGYHSAGASSLILHPSSLSKGIYVLKLETGSTATTSKLIIQ